MKFSGIFKGVLTNTKTGEVICWEKHNKVVRGGFNWIADLMKNKTARPSSITHIAFGTGNTPTDYEMSTLEKEVYRAEVETPVWDEDNRTLTFKGTIPINSNINDSITEVGLFTAVTGGIMFDRATFSPKGIDNDMSFDYFFDIIITE